MNYKERDGNRQGMRSMTTTSTHRHGRGSHQEIVAEVDGSLTVNLQDEQSCSKRERAAKLSALVLAVAGTGAASSGHAEQIIGYGGPAELSIIPEVSSVQVGTTITADVSLSGLSNQLIGSYDITVDFDPSLLSVSNVTYGSYLDGPDNSIQVTNTSVSSQVEAYEVSLGSLANQTGSGTIPLFSITFNSLAAGTSALSFDPVANAGTLISDQNGNPFTNFVVVNSSVTVMPAPAVAAPELDLEGAGGPITALVAAFLIVAERRRRT